MWTPTRRKTGEGSTEGKNPARERAIIHNQTAPIRSTGVVGTAYQKGNRASVGEAGMVAGVATREQGEPTSPEVERDWRTKWMS
jgi:hypothetical protein